MKIVGFLGGSTRFPPAWSEVHSLVKAVENVARRYRFASAYSIQFESREDDYDRADFQMVVFRGINRIATCADPDHAYGVLRMVMSQMEEDGKRKDERLAEESRRIEALFERTHKPT